MERGVVSDEVAKGLLRRDGKSFPFSSTAVAFLVFVLYLLVVLPLAFVVLAPMLALSLLYKKVFGSRPVPVASSVAESSSPSPPLALASDVRKRKYDIVILGATGFTGGLACRYLASRYGREIRWAIAGRRADALATLQAELTRLYSQSSKGKETENGVCDILVVDTLNEASLREVVPLTTVILSTVGPFARYGSLVVKVCCDYGTHYCDITGETDWVRRMIEEYHLPAQKSGANIVHFCGHDCVPWDLCVRALADHMKAKDENLKEVRCYDEIRGSASGGTLETVFVSLENRTHRKPLFGFDPLMLEGFSKDGPIESSNRTSRRNPSFLSYATDMRRWTAPFVMADVMYNCVKRSNAVLGYGKNITYKEAMVFPNFFAAFIYYANLMIFGVSLFCPPFKYFLRTFVLPAPGSGPSEGDMDEGFLKVNAFGVGDRGTKAKVSLYFPTDPGYRDTARMLVESGLCLALEKDKIRTRGGVFTPAVCLGDVLLTRLCNTGSTYCPPSE